VQQQHDILISEKLRNVSYMAAVISRLEI